MIYLFNSAFNPTYFQNVYRLMGMPHHSRVEMRYSESVNAPAIETDRAFKNKPCIVCYVERFSVEGYRYYPIRHGVVRAIKREHGRAYYSVELLNHCYSPAASEFTDALTSQVDYSPRLTDNDPECGNDGLYCVDGPDLSAHVRSGSDSWTRASEQVYQTRAFQVPVPAFFFAELRKGNDRPDGTSQGLALHANTEYELVIYYTYPADRLTDSRKKLVIRIGTEINRELVVGSVSDRLAIPINLPPLDFSSGAIEIQSIKEETTSSGGEAVYTASIPFRTAAWRANLLLFAFLLLIAFLDEFSQVGFALNNGGAWLSTLFEFLKFAIVIWAVFKYRGKLKLPGL